MNTMVYGISEVSLTTSDQAIYDSIVTIARNQGLNLDVRIKVGFFADSARMVLSLPEGPTTQSQRDAMENVARAFGLV